MKKSLFTTAFLTLFGFACLAQSQGDIRGAAGIALGTKSGVDASGSKIGLGLNIGAEYLITDIISVAPSYTMFFKSSVNGTDFKSSVINVDGRYYFGENGLYGLAGFSTIKSKVEGNGVTGEGTNSGLNLGAGMMYPLSDGLMANGQVKYQTVGDGQLVINFGVAMSF